MERHTKYFLVGATLASIILLGGYLTSIYDNSQLSSLVAKCKAETAQAPKGPWLDFQKAALVCEPDVLSKLGAENAVGIQKEIVVSRSASGRTFNNAKVTALVVFLLFGTPYAWYFLLRRIRELRDAVVGK